MVYWSIGLQAQVCVGVYDGTQNITIDIIPISSGGDPCEYIVDLVFTNDGSTNLGFPSSSFDFGSLVCISANCSTSLEAPSTSLRVTLQGSGPCTDPMPAISISTVVANALDGCDIVPVVVPVELINFSAFLDEETILLQWQTASELNNTGFEVQRSKDGQNWQVIDFIKGYGTTTEAQQYKWLDEQPYAGENYYQLKQIDEDGSSEYSDIVIIEMASKGTDLEVFPNPTQNILQYHIANMDALERVQLFDMYGKLLKTDMDIDGTLNLDDLPKGMYLLLAETPTRQYRQTVVKQ